MKLALDDMSNNILIVGRLLLGDTHKRGRVAR